MGIKLVGTGLTDVGMTRDHNEDNLLVNNELELFVVADGVGGQNAGEVASRMAVEVINSHCTKAMEDDAPFIGQPNEALGEEVNRMASAIRLANQVVFETSQSNPSLKGMGSTVVAVTATGEGRLAVAHAGDSRAYLLRHGGMFQLTNDHSLVAEQVRAGLITPEAAATSKIRNVITRALGVGPELEVDMDEQPLEDGDVILLCSDGLTGMVDDDTIAATIEQQPSLEKACEELIRLANENGGKDNITAVLVRAVRTGFMSSLRNIFKL